MQNSKKWLKIILIALPSLALMLSGAQAKTPTNAKQASGKPADSIVAVVNTNIITRHQLDNRMATLKISGNRAVEKQVLDALIDEELMRFQADLYGIVVDDARVQAALVDIASSNNLTVEGLYAATQKYKMDWKKYIANVASQIRMEELRNYIVGSRVMVTERDIDAFLAQHPTGLYDDKASRKPTYEKREVVERSFVPKAMALQHIFIHVPDGASEGVVAAAKKKADEALSKIRKGQSFASVAKQYSEAPEASQGGDLGIRMNEDWPSLFLSATRNVKDGSTTGVFKAPNGFHILKVRERRGIINEQRKVVNVAIPLAQLSPREKAALHDGPVEVTESHVRHILVRTTPVFSAQQAKEKIDGLYQRLQSGEAFADVALHYSQDASAPLGGDIGWIAPGQTDPNFEASVNALQIGQVSKPVQSAFGWHIIEVLDRRTEDKQAELRRELARDTLYQEQANYVLQDWLQQLRAEAYIDNFLTPKANKQ